MIIPEHKLIYIHVPKTGGTSIETFLLDYFNLGERSPFYLLDGIGKRETKEKDGKLTFYPYMHFPLAWIEEELAKINIIVDETWNIFSVVRNPYHKLLSELFFTDLSPLIYNYHTLPDSSKNHYFNQCLNEYLEEKDVWKNNHSLHTTPQYVFFEGSKLNNIKIAQFEDGLENIVKTLGFEVKNPFPHRLNTFEMKSSPKPNYHDVMTRHFVELVNTKYKLDFKTFGYKMLEPLDFPE